MQDLVVKGTGNSRTLKSSIPAGTTWEQALAMFQAGTFPVDLNGLNADGIQVMGTPYSKCAVLPDDVLTKIGLPTSGVPADMFRVLADLGNLYVWKKYDSENNATTYEVNTNRNTWPDDPSVGEIGARYELGGLVIGDFPMSPGSIFYSYWSYSDSISVSDDGTISLVNPNIIMVSAGADVSTIIDTLKGKFVIPGESSGGYFSVGTIIYFPSDVSISVSNSDGIVYVDRYQEVRGYPKIPATTQYTYLGPLGDKPRFQVLSYVGTGTYGTYDYNIVTFDFKPKIVFIVPEGKSIYNIFCWVYNSTYYYAGYASNSSYYENAKATFHDDTNILWFSNTQNSEWQYNTSGVTYKVIALG